MKNLSEVLPIYSAENDMLLSKAGDITIVFRLELPEVFTLSNAEYEAIHQGWLKAIKTLTPGAILHKQDWFTESIFKGSFADEKSFLSHASERHFHERAFYHHECFLSLTLTPANRKPVNSFFSTLLRKHIVPVETLDPAFAKGFEGTCLQFIRVLSDTGLVKCERLENEALVQYVNQYLLLDIDQVIRDISFDGGIQVGEKHCELLTLASADHLPPLCGPRIDLEKYSTDQTRFPIGFAAPVGLLLDCDHVYNQYLVMEDSAAVAKTLEGRKKRLHSLSAYSRDNAFARDSVEEYLNELVAGQQTPVRAHFNVLAWTNDREQAQALRNKCAAAFAKMDAQPKIETVGAPQIFWAGIPGNAADLPINETFSTFAAQGVCFFNQETQYLTSSSIFGLRLGDRISARPLHVDISDEPMERGITSNRNKFILGPSGSGKSFFTNHMLRSYYEQGAHIVMVDVGHSYKGLCELLGGYYFSYGDTEPIRFNPFHIEAGGTPDGEKKESIKNLLVTLWKKDDEQFSRSEYVALSIALQLYYEKSVVFRCFDSFYEFLQNEFMVRLAADKVKEKDFDVANFLYVLRPYYKGGEYDYLLNATENLDLLHQRFIVFELDTIKDHPILFPVATIIIMEMFIAKIRKLKGVRKMIMIEEAWKAISKAGMAEFMKYVYKTIRKHFGEAVVVTQELDDILSSEIVKKTIIAMSDCKILFDQSKYEQRFGEVQELLGLSEKEKTLVLSLNKANDPTRKYKEVFISLGGRISKVYRVEVSREEYLTYTTEEKEKMKVMDSAQKHGSIEKGIKALVMATACLLLWVGASAQSIDPVSIVIAKVIKAIDIKVQKLQNETLWLQQAQQLAEQELSKAKLSEIAGWQRQLSDLYAGYFAELRFTKSSIAGMAQVKRIFEMQQEVVIEYGRLGKDANSKPSYDNLLNGSTEILHTVYAVVGSGLSMKDAERVSLIVKLKDAMSRCLESIRTLNRQQIQRTELEERMRADLRIVKKLNGIQ